LFTRIEAEKLRSSEAIGRLWRRDNPTIAITGATLARARAYADPDGEKALRYNLLGLYWGVAKRQGTGFWSRDRRFESCRPSRYRRHER
jgi:hypothetical protein